MSQDIPSRLKAHNKGKVRSNKAHRPFELVYSETVGDRLSARKRGKYFKSVSGRPFFKQMLSLHGVSPPA
jgi:putative endonuclease